MIDETSGEKMSAEDQVSRIYEIKIAGMELRLRSDQSEERVRKLAALVDKHVSKLLNKKSTVNVKQALLLTCLDLAGDLYDLKTQSMDHLQDIEKEALELKKTFRSSFNL